jgi:hypothetical protein
MESWTGSSKYFTSLRMQEMAHSSFYLILWPLVAFVVGFLTLIWFGGRMIWFGDRMIKRKGRKK